MTDCLRVAGLVVYGWYLLNDILRQESHEFNVEADHKLNKKSTLGSRKSTTGSRFIVYLSTLDATGNYMLRCDGEESKLCIINPCLSRWRPTLFSQKIQLATVLYRKLDVFCGFSKLKVATYEVV